MAVELIKVLTPSASFCEDEENDNLPDPSDTFEADRDPQLYLESYAAIKSDMQKIENNAKALKKLSQRYNSSTSKDQTHGIVQIVDDIISSNRSMKQRISSALKTEKDKNDEYLQSNKGSTISQWKVNELNSYNIRFKTSCLEFSSNLNALNTKLREAQKRYIIILDDGKLSETEKDQLVNDYEQTQIFVQKQFQMIGTSNSTAELEMRYQGMFKIQKSIQKYQEMWMWMELNILATEQQDMLDVITNNVEETRDYVKPVIIKRLQEAEPSLRPLARTLYEYIMSNIRVIENDAKEVKKLSNRYHLSTGKEQIDVIMRELYNIISFNSNIRQKINTALKTEQDKNDKYLKSNEQSSLGQWRVKQLNSCNIRFKSSCVEFSSNLNAFNFTISDKEKQHIDMVDDNKLSEEMVTDYERIQKLIQNTTHMTEENGSNWEPPTNMATNPDQYYEFADLELWLNTLNLSHIYNALKQENFETLDVLVQLNESDLDELCDIIRTNIQTEDVSFTLSNKGLFKSNVVREKEKFDHHMQTKKLDSYIEMYERVMNCSANGIKDSKFYQQSAMQSISDISNKMQMVMSNLCEVMLEKYLKGHNILQKHAERSLLKLREVKQKCEKILTNNEIEDGINEAVEKSSKFFETADDFAGDECLTTIIQSILTDVNIIKICQQIASFALVPFRQTLNVINVIESLSEDYELSSDTHIAYLMILPHAIGYIEDIKNELNERNICIIKECGSIASDKTSLLLMKQYSGLIDHNFHQLEKEQKIGYKPNDDEDKSSDDKEENKSSNDHEYKKADVESEDKKDTEDDNQSDSDEFEIDKVYIPDAGYITMAVHYHMDKYFETMVNPEATVYMIEMHRYSDDLYAEYFSNNFEIYCPAIIGEYAAMYHPKSINGKFMDIFRKTRSEKRLNSMVNVGFVQVINSEVWEDVFDEID